MKKFKAVEGIKLLTSVNQESDRKPIGMPIQKNLVTTQLANFITAIVMRLKNALSSMSFQVGIRIHSEMNE